MEALSFLGGVILTVIVWGSFAAYERRELMAVLRARQVR